MGTAGLVHLLCPPLGLLRAGPPSCPGSWDNILYPAELLSSRTWCTLVGYLLPSSASYPTWVPERMLCPHCTPEPGLPVRPVCLLSAATSSVCLSWLQNRPLFVPGSTSRLSEHVFQLSPGQTLVGMASLSLPSSHLGNGLNVHICPCLLSGIDFPQDLELCGTACLLCTSQLFLAR